MREIKLTIDINKKIQTNGTKLGNKWDNGVTKLIFIIPTEYNFAFKYCVFENKSLANTILYPLNPSDNSIIITTSISQYAGQWGVTFLATETEIIAGDIINTSLVAVSDTINLTINDNSLTDPQPSGGIDENLQVIYDELQATVIYLNSVEFKELIKGAPGINGVDGYSPVRGVDYWTQEDINTIETNLQTYINNIYGDINSVLDLINGEVI